MQILPVIMRLLVILSVSLTVARAGTLVSYSDAVNGTLATIGGAGDTGVNSGSARNLNGGAFLVLKRPPNPVVVSSVGLPRQRSIQDASLVGAQSGAASPAVSERNVYRTKLSKLKLILLADMLNEIPPQLELITCLANSSSINVTTKHCDCESYSCKDLLTLSSGSSPLNSVNQRKLHTTCGEFCCRKKKFNRSIDPTIQNAVAAVFRHNSFVSTRNQPQPSAGVMSPPSSGILVRATNSSAPAPQPAARQRRWNCEGSIVNQMAISSNGKGRSGIDQSQPTQHQQQEQFPWLYRVILIEREVTICAGSLIHPNVLLTTAVCVINKNPEQLIARRRPAKNDRLNSTTPAVEMPSRAVRKIIMPDQFMTTFERLENNVALLVLHSAKQLQTTANEEDSERRPNEQNLSYPSSTSSSTSEQQSSISSTPQSNTNQEDHHRREHGYATLPVATTGSERTLLEPSPYICLSSVINYSSAFSNVCQTYSWRKMRKSAAAGQRSGNRRQRRNHRQRQRSYHQQHQQQQQLVRSDDGANYITANISIFPGSSGECQREHRDYLQHQGNLCAGPVDKSRSLNVDLSGSPLICTEFGQDGKARVELRGILTWSTDINRAPHLFTNITTYRSWIENELNNLDQLEL
ncbi:uncharacterized protein LOC129769228 [Toxorhynchites rutilus septentrionalis]|uniref:uncharacterized protein LOC129769228 n=1 Tax=Toxorhynchites rutilus septentrionalis TaxID=329112 RepID=UPI00247AD6F8|nr:uncharacterized protein LOC129769228 [Toxorhynchites rutilus septentrionalis]XP_055627309.1 uncharacterized protein LOC129769228 [Toxorhynchites rutilus septentrionalis]XP_055627310.1 uncharacterized protein LOC129769228 [Toxorhynchites rutilus septentrionalis]XP_055627311.1 uncharacterized protein LOC129769228 [Toxorhynchites rutilus septentrionalis]